jgi:hypothetical protein
MSSHAADPPVAGRIARSMWRWLGRVFVLSFGALALMEALA